MSWNKVWVLEGEPFYFKYIIEEIKEEPAEGTDACCGDGMVI